MRATSSAFVLAAAGQALRSESTAESAPASNAFSVNITPSAGSDHLQLNEAIARALRSNKRVTVSNLGRGIARANVLAEYGRFEPAITARRNVSEDEYPAASGQLINQVNKTDDYAVGLTGLAPWGLYYEIGTSARNQRDGYNPHSDKFVTFGGISVTQPLLRGFGFGANLASLRIAKADQSISDWEHRQTVIDTVTQVVIAYQDLVQARETLRIAQRSRDLAAKLVSDNEKRNRIGAISDADVTQARARVVNREELILIAERSVRDIENRLRELMGESDLMSRKSDLLVDPLTPVPISALDGASELRTALEQRPDYQAAKLGLAKYRASRAYARNQLLPRVDFVGSYGYNGVDRDFGASRSQVRDQDHRAYSAGVVVSVPLTFAEGRGRARAAKYALQRSEADLERLERDIALDVAAAIGQLETTARRVDATARAYDLAQQALDAEQKRFLAGTSSTFFVLQLQEQLAAVQSSHVRAVADQHRAIANYERETGRTLASHRIVVE